jgi:hypothetical protein
MTEAARTPEQPSMPIRLEVRASDPIKELVGSLIKEELQPAFARSAFLTLALQSRREITLPLADKGKTNTLTPEAKLIRSRYRHLVEDINAKDQIFLRKLHIAPQFGYRHMEDGSMARISFRLSLTTDEKERLLKPPFDSIDPDMVVVGRIFKDDDLKTGEELEEAIVTARKKLLTGSRINPRNNERQAMPDLYYVTRPTLKP